MTGVQTCALPILSVCLPVRLFVSSTAFFYAYMYCTVLYCTVVLCTILNYTIQHNAIQCNLILHYTYTVSYCTVLYCTYLSWPCPLPVSPSPSPPPLRVLAPRLGGNNWAFSARSGDESRPTLGCEGGVCVCVCVWSEGDRVVWCGVL